MNDLVTILVGGGDVSGSVVWAQTSFSVSASAQPGLCQIVVRDPDESFSFTAGDIISCQIAHGDVSLTMWTGYLMTVTEGYAFEDAPVRLWTLAGVDLNILLDKLIMYNHAHPTWYPDGGGAYKRERVLATDGTTYGYEVTVPQNTMDVDYINNMLADFDLGLVAPPIHWGGSDSKIESIGQINPDGNFTPPSSGTNLRGFLADVSTNVQRSMPGSSIWYIDPYGYIVYREQDMDNAPFYVTDQDPTIEYNGLFGVNVRALSVTTDISNLHNDVLVFTGTLDPAPGSTQTTLYCSHETNADSVTSYGLHQYSETLNSDWLPGMADVRAEKILYQQGTPAMRVEFKTFEFGLYPGQRLPVVTALAPAPFLIPIRQIDINFLTPTTVEYSVTCSFDTLDPWGLLLALKQPVSRGLTQPNFNVIDLTQRTPGSPIPPAQTFTFVKEFPRALGNSTYKCSYAYIRDSITVYVGAYRQISIQDPKTGTVGFLETDPDSGTFQIGSGVTGGQSVYVEYHVWHNL